MSSINATFEDAIRVIPQGSNKYSAHLRPEWCIGTVPHGGYTAAVIYKLALTHFSYAHPEQYDTPATPISLQLSFLRRTAAGPTILEVEDLKLGTRTSTIQAKLFQPSEKDPGRLELKLTGFITVSPPSAEVGISASTGWKPYPATPLGSLADGRVNLSSLAQIGRDGAWIKLNTPFPEFRRAGTQVELYGPSKRFTHLEQTESMVVDQWSRFRPGGDKSARWTDAAVVYLTDMFPMAMNGFDSVSTTAVAKTQGTSSGKQVKFWYPTVTLNIEMKKHLPTEGGGVAI
ncbi:hypothetical protein N7495_002886 [Penicillium taxi]|uniref:uncharacterized protein n=1 Tax=Penicillium taxi TaxID=168475 RepID=UPI0025457BF6|nr:uncharacterized protein N7495_002886 [Penicillium taxi]KAJ5902358.1 hypothetical protein N7495_002886 [Penicillium taxi]